MALGEGVGSPETQPSHILANVPYRPGLAKLGRRAPRRWGWGGLVERTARNRHTAASSHRPCVWGKDRRASDDPSGVRPCPVMTEKTLWCGPGT